MVAAAERTMEFTIRKLDLESASPRLDRNQVHIWTLPLEDTTSAHSLREFLSPDELERASRFRFEKHRAQYLLTRGTLRSLLGSYLGISPHEIAFQYSEYDKPRLKGDQNLDFNLSHTEGMAIFGFTRGHRIGVDIERLRSDFRADEIAERFFSPSERVALREVSEERRREFFFRIWTRKEAFIKALGEGLSHPLHQFDVSLDDAAALLATRPIASHAARWQLENLRIAPDFIAAAAVELDGAAEVTP